MNHRKTLNNLTDDYDVIVIGSGLGGLTAARRLSVFGHRVLLLEQHKMLGGLATWFRRRKDVFDVSLHGFPIGMKKSLRKYWTQEIADRVVPLKRIIFDNPQFSLETTFTKDDFIRIITENFKVPLETINGFFNDVRKMDFFDNQQETTGQLFERYFPGRSDVVRLLMEPIAYANGSTTNEPAITYGIVFSNFMSKGVYTIEGGTDWLINTMEKELLSTGVDICTGECVDQIIVANGNVAGVSVGGRQIKAKTVISNANLKATVLDMLPRTALPTDFIQDAEEMRLSSSSTQVYIGLKDGLEIPDIGDLLFTSTSPEFSSDELSAMTTRSRTFSVYYPKTRPGHNRSTIVASSNARYDDWAALDDEDYAVAKAELIERALTDLDRYLPGIRENIVHLEAATPKTFEYYTRHPGGASFGTKFEGLKVSDQLPDVIPGLYHTGSAGIIMSGWLGAANYGAIVANNVDRFLS
ncbi:phytoene dehydrogenase [bacterium F16]|nr:phytoene dehydrogenase [bacterium F16]